MSFGFSVGDFIAAGKLTNDIISSLQTVGGARSEYQELMRELQSLQTALRYLDRLDDQVPPSQHVLSIKCAALMCLYPLQEFLKKVKKYEASLGPRRKSHAVISIKDKLRWSFTEKDEIVRLRAYLSVHTKAIDIMLVHYGLERLGLMEKDAEKAATQVHAQLENAKAALGDLQKDSTRQLVALRTTHSMLGNLSEDIRDEIKPALQQASRAITTASLSTQQSHALLLEIRNSVTSIDTRFTYFETPYKIEDARGFVFPVPSEFSYDELENIIRYRFRKGAGARDVREGNYELCNTKKRSERNVGERSTTRISHNHGHHHHYIGRQRYRICLSDSSLWVIQCLCFRWRGLPMP